LDCQLPFSLVKGAAYPQKLIGNFRGFFAWLIDGMNSFLGGLLGSSLLYPLNNAPSLITGFGMGLCLATIVFILFNYTMWQNEILMTIFSYICISM